MQKHRTIINKLQLARVLMIGAILLIVAFQGYWINRLYREEKGSLGKETTAMFRDAIYNLQVARFKADTLFYQTTDRPNLFTFNAVNAIRRKVSELKGDSAKGKKIIFDTSSTVTLVVDNKKGSDSASVKQHFTYRGNVPPELEEMIRKRATTGITDTAAPRKLSKMMGTNVILRANIARQDSITNHQRPAFPPMIERKEPVLIGLADSGRHRAGPPRWNVRFDSKHPEKALVRLISDGKALDDTIPLKKIDSAFSKELEKGKISLAFTLHTGKDDSLHRKDTVAASKFHTQPEAVGFMKPAWYQAEFEDPSAFLIKRISPQILFSVFLIAFTSVTFIFLYRNLAEQRRLTEMKNDFISNITHELKTPIATVSVAVEALRNFGGIQSPERTKEYLDISAAELQRLGLLVDKVLKLSLFENRELELKKESLDLKQLTEEVLNTMKLQFEKQHAKLNLEVQGFYFTINADRLHITSVIYNLLDNALKYSNANPEVTVRLRHETDHVILEVTDKGIGIAPGFRDKIFEKFFRVPTGDHHNIKGYGLGLSYVSHVVKKHEGTITVQSEPGKGSTFTVKFPVA